MGPGFWCLPLTIISTLLKTRLQVPDRTPVIVSPGRRHVQAQGRACENPSCPGTLWDSTLRDTKQGGGAEKNQHSYKLAPMQWRGGEGAGSHRSYAVEWGRRGRGTQVYLSRALDTFFQPKQQIQEKLHVGSLNISLGTEHSSRTLRHAEDSLSCSAKPVGSHKEIEMS